MGALEVTAFSGQTAVQVSVLAKHVLGGLPEVVIPFGQQVGNGGAGEFRRRDPELLGGMPELFGLRRRQFERYVHALNVQPGHAV